MKALVTGVAGFIGSHLAQALLDRGDEIVGVDSFLDYYPREIKRKNLAPLTLSSAFQLVEAPVQALDLDSLLADVEAVFHLAAQAGVRASWGRDFSIYTENNILATQRLLEASVGRPLRAFVFASSSSVYGEVETLPMREDVPVHPVSPYGVSKMAAEMLCRLYHLNHRVPTVSLRYFTVYGPRQRPDMAFHRLLRSVLSGEEVPVYGDGRQTRDFTFVADAVSATLAASERGRAGGVYNIGGGSRVSLLEVIETIEAVTGKNLRLRHQPPQKGDMRDTYADIRAAGRDLDYQPSVRLREGLEAEWRWIRLLLGAAEPPHGSSGNVPAGHGL